MAVPAGGSYDDAGAEGEDGANVFNCSFGSGEVDDDVDAGEIRCGKRRSVLILVDVKCADAMAAFTRDFSDEAAGFSFAEYEDEHKFLRNSGSCLVVSG